MPSSYKKRGRGRQRDNSWYKARAAQKNHIDGLVASGVCTFEGEHSLPSGLSSGGIVYRFPDPTGKNKEGIDVVFYPKGGTRFVVDRKHGGSVRHRELVAHNLVFSEPDKRLVKEYVKNPDFDIDEYHRTAPLVSRKDKALKMKRTKERKPRKRKPKSDKLLSQAQLDRMMR